MASTLDISTEHLKPHTLNLEPKTLTLPGPPQVPLKRALIALPSGYLGYNRAELRGLGRTLNPGFRV